MRFEAKGLAKAFAGPPIFRDISLSVERGLVAVTGRNGSGKSTLLKIFAGLVRPTGGSVSIWRGDALLTGPERRSAIGFASPEIDFPEELSAAENLALLAQSGGAPRSRSAVGALLESFGLAPADHERTLSEFSSGMRQRVRLAFSQLFDPPILLWDEPYANLDAAGIEAARSRLDARRRDGLVIVATNDRGDVADAELEIALA